MSSTAGPKRAVSALCVSVSLLIDGAYKSTLIVVLAACLLGCGSPDLPTARHAIVPVPVSDLSARQVGDTVILNFTLPSTSTDQQPLADMPSVEIYRSTPQSIAAGSKAAGKNKNAERLADTIPAETLGQYEKNGHIEFPDKLDAGELSNDGGTELIYTVKTRLSRAKASASSNGVTLRVYPAPAPIRDLRATLTETALVLDWSAAQETRPGSPGKTAGFRIYRAEVDPSAAGVAISNPSQAKLITPPELLAQTTATEYRDMTVQFGHTYFYEIREVMQLGTETVESSGSLPAVLTAKDIVPPEPPQGVEAVSMAATAGTPPAIELTWTIGAETDLAGYNVYRSEQSEGPGQKLNSELLLAPTFRDMSVAPGKTYFYRVGAVDQAGNESALSPSVEAHVPEP